MSKIEVVDKTDSFAANLMDQVTKDHSKIDYSKNRIYKVVMWAEFIGGEVKMVVAVPNDKVNKYWNDENMRVDSLDDCFIIMAFSFALYQFELAGYNDADINSFVLVSCDRLMPENVEDELLKKDEN